MIGAALAGLALLLAQSPATPAPELVGEVRVHGNHTTPDAEVLALSGLAVGAPVAADTLTQAESRLRASGRFAGVEVRKRFRSITDPSDILVILLVDEHAAVSKDDLMPGPMKRLRGAGMWFPVLDYADGYGFTYGARVSFVDALGARSRLSVPLTWGGERRAALEVDRSFARGPFSRVEGALSITRRENPHYELADTRQEARVRAERAITPWLRVGGGARVAKVDFDGLDQTHVAPGLDLIVDTRRDPAFPRNAIHATVGLEQLRFADHPHAARRSADVRGYVGLIGSSVLAVRATTTLAGAALPRYEQALLGGTSILRGYRFGYRTGDNLAAASAELRVPITSPLSFARLGVKAFVDAGTVYAHGTRLTDQTFDRGIGGGVFLTAPVLRMGLDVAWPTSGSPRWHFGLGVAF